MTRIDLTLEPLDDVGVIHPTDEESETNLHPIKDGGTIIVALYSLAKTNNPLFYFGSLGVSGIIAGGFIASYVLWQWVQHGQGHEILALVSAAAILLGVQLLMFGVLSDMLVTLHREQRRRLEQITREARERDDE